MKIAFFGTPVFSAKILEALASRHEIIVCVTAPDAKSNRGRKLNPPEVKKLAMERGIEVRQPLKLNAEFLEEFKSFDVDLAVVVSYGRIIPESYLNLLKYGFINIHASILPRWRGAAPIHRAIMSGDRESGISIMQMDKGLDTGDVHSIWTCSIDAEETTGSLHDKLLELGREAISDFLDRLEDCERTGRSLPIPQRQDDALSTYADKIKKEMAIIDWSRDGIEIERLIRGLNPYPSAKTAHKGELLKLHMASFVPAKHALDFGTVEEANTSGIKVACRGGFIRVTQIQKAGSKAMGVAEFLRGYPVAKGEIFS